MRTLFNGEPHVHYGQIYIESGSGGIDGELAECFSGQANGLCGAARPGQLFLITGLHTGNVGFTVELHTDEPPVDDGWQEIVEASFRLTSTRVGLCQWAGEVWWDLDLPEDDYRVRYCATGMDEAHAADLRRPDEPFIDQYLLQFWPSPPAEDRVIKQTSAHAAYWHGTVLGTYPSAEERAKRKREAELVDEDREHIEAEKRRQQALARETIDWGGREPSDLLRAVGTNARNLAAVDRELVDAIAVADSDRQRQIARAAARTAFSGAGLTELDWVAAALAALDRGDDLPAPFDDHNAVSRRLFGEEPVPTTIVPGTADHSRQATALPAIFQATQPDPLWAAVETLWTAVSSFGTDRDRVLSEIRALLG